MHSNTTVPFRSKPKKGAKELLFVSVQHLPYFNVNPLLAGKFTIEIGRRPRREAPLASHIEVFRRKIEMGAE